MIINKPKYLYIILRTPRKSCIFSTSIPKYNSNQKVLFSQSSTIPRSLGIFDQWVPRFNVLAATNPWGLTKSFFYLSFLMFISIHSIVPLFFTASPETTAQLVTACALHIATRRIRVPLTFAITPLVKRSWAPLSQLDGAAFFAALGPLLEGHTHGQRPGPIRRALTRILTVIEGPVSGYGAAFYVARGCVNAVSFIMLALLCTHGVDPSPLLYTFLPRPESTWFANATCSMFVAGCMLNLLRPLRLALLPAFYDFAGPRLLGASFYGRVRTDGRRMLPPVAECAASFASQSTAVAYASSGFSSWHLLNEARLRSRGGYDGTSTSANENHQILTREVPVNTYELASELSPVAWERVRALKQRNTINDAQ